MTKPFPAASEIFAACVCLGVQRAARGLARRYDGALRPAGVTSGQFAILSALVRDEPVPLTDLANQLGLDRTTLNRNLAPLATAHLVASGTTGDRRVRTIELSDAGRERLAVALPLWRAVQDDTHARLGDAGWPALRPALGRLA